MLFYEYVLPPLLLLNIIVYTMNSFNSFANKKKKTGIWWAIGAIFWTAILIIRIYIGVN